MLIFHSFSSTVCITELFVTITANICTSTHTCSSITYTITSDTSGRLASNWYSLQHLWLTWHQKQRTTRNDIVLLIVCRQKYSPLLHVSVHVMYKRPTFNEPFTMYWHPPTVLLTDWRPPTVLTGVQNVIITGVNQYVFVCSVLIYVQRTTGFTTIHNINLRFTYLLTGADGMSFPEFGSGRR